MLARLRVLASDSLIYGVSGILTRFLSVWLVPIYTRLFSPEDYGVLSLVASTFAVVAVFAVLALDNSAARWYWDTDDTSDRKRTIVSGALCQLAVASGLGLAMFLAGDFLASLIVQRSDAGKYFRLLALTLPLNQLSIVVSGWLRMQRRPVATTVFMLGSSVLQIGLTLLFVVGWRWGLTGIYVAQVVQLAVSAIVAVVLLGDWIDPRRFDWTRLRGMLTFALPLIPSALAVWIVSFADRYFVQLFASTAEVGLFSLGSALAQGMLLLTGAFQLAWGPFALSIHKEADAKRTYAQAFLIYIAATSFLASALSLFAPEVIRLLATEKFIGAASVVGLLALSYVMIGLGYIAATGPAVMKVTAPIGIAITAAAVLNVLLNFLLVPRYGKMGAAAATLAAQSLGPLVLFWRSQRIYPVPYRFGAGMAFLSLSLALVVIGLAFPLQGLTGIVFKLLLLALYLPLLFALELLTPARARAMLVYVRSRAS